SAVLGAECRARKSQPATRGSSVKEPPSLGLTHVLKCRQTIRSLLCSASFPSHSFMPKSIRLVLVCREQKKAIRTFVQLWGPLIAFLTTCSYIQTILSLCELSTASFCCFLQPRILFAGETSVMVPWLILLKST